MQALFTLTPAESKRLIGKAMAALPEIQNAKNKGYLLVGRGSTNAYILEELLGKKIKKEAYAVGQVIRGISCALAAGDRIQPVTFHKGEILAVEPTTVLDKLAPGDILLKGANALDPNGNVGIFMGNPTGGSIGQAYLGMKARGLDIVYPVGLEKMIPSVELAAQYGGLMVLKQSIGCRTGIACIGDGTVFTEIEAIENLFDLEAIHVGSGGWGGAEGAVTIVVEGLEAKVKKCIKYLEKFVKGEPPLPAMKSPCKGCPMSCSFNGKEEKQLPAWLRT